MKKAKALRLHKAVVGKSLNGWLVGEFLGNGMSAIVAEAQKEGVSGAIKVFDPEIAQLYGKAKQLGRIERECKLIGFRHPHLVEILDGGEWDVEGLLYVVMGRVDAANLEDQRKRVPRTAIPVLIAQVASAARALLEDRGIAHRDIKPSNIAVDCSFSHATLLDLGVQRPLEADDITSLTDTQQKPFLGTLRYASPEFLFGDMEYSADGWRAVTIYQLGAVLHDLITRKQIFGHIVQPYARLARAIERELPKIEAQDVPANLIALAQRCLVKDWRRRLQLVTWEDFEPRNLVPVPSTIDSARSRRTLATELRKVKRVAPVDTEAQQSAWLRSTASQSRTALRKQCVQDESIPRALFGAIRKVGTTSLAWRLTFPPSEEFGLSETAVFEVMVTVVDPSEKMVKATVCGGLLSSEATAPDVELGQSCLAWQGPATSIDLGRRLFELLHAFLLRIAEMPDGAAGKTESGVLLLDLGAEDA